MTIINDYLKITKEYSEIYGEKTLLLMQVGSFFECYALVLKDGTYSGSRIQEFAEINDMTISRKNICVSGQSVVMAGFGLPQLEKYVKKMQDHGYTIVVYTQDTPSKNTTRSLSCIYSPGTFFSSDSQELSNNTTCIWIHYSKANQVSPEQITIGLSNLDIYTGKTSIYEFSTEFHHNPCTYDELEKYIAVYKPNETIIISNLDEEIIDNIIQFANITSIQIHRIDTRKNTNELEQQAVNAEKQKYQDAILQKFFNQECGITEYYNYCIASQSFCFLLEFIYKHNPNLVTKIEKPIIENYGEKLILANHSLKQLNIISDNRYSGKLGSVSSFLNNCVTTMGKRQFNYDLLNPITNQELLNKSYNITEHVLKENNWEFLRNSLVNVRDLEKIKRKLIMNKITPKDFYNLYTNLSTLRDCYKNIKKDPILLAHINSYISCNFEDTCKKLCDFIKKNFDLNKCRYLDDIGADKLGSLSLENLCYINKSINPDLDLKTKLCVDSRELFECIRKYFSDTLKSFEKNSKTNDFIKIHETPKMDAQLIGTKRRVTILKTAIEKMISNDQNSVQLKYTSKYSNLEESIELDLTKLEFKAHGGNQSNLIITSSQIYQIANSIQSSKDALITELMQFYNRIIADFMKLDERKDDPLGNLDNIIIFTSQTDILQCKCYIAQKYNYCKPIIETAEKAFIRFEKIRHCLIEQLNSKELYVTNDLELGKEVNGLLLYGTNAVGKTSLIKAMGIAIIMAQAGLYVPCSKFTYSPYNYVFTRILGNDNIFKGLSTFAVEMSELRTILKQANNNSLILGDELCSGTESTSALSIFAAGLEKLHEIESSFIFATHFHEIAKYEEIEVLDKLKLYHMTVIYNKARNQLIYDRKLKEGPGENMYGLEVCKSLDLPYAFLERAHSLRLKYTGKDGILLKSGSHFNSKKLRDMCELCKNDMGTEIHHLQHQKNAINGIINQEFNKNHPANLINICQTCHEKIHKSNIQHKIVKTSDGYEIAKI